MKKEEKQLLFKDICARLPYGVKVENTSYSEPQVHTLFGKVSDDLFLMLETYKSVGSEDYRRVTDDVHYTGFLETIKPYLRPLSSMTEDEKKVYHKLLQMSVTVVMPNMVRKEITYTVDLEDDGDGLNHLYDWFNENHFDYRGLIPMGLALEATEEMYKTD